MPGFYLHGITKDHQEIRARTSEQLDAWAARIDPARRLWVFDGMGLLCWLDLSAGKPEDWQGEELIAPRLHVECPLASTPEKCAETFTNVFRLLAEGAAEAQKRFDARFDWGRRSAGRYGGEEQPPAVAVGSVVLCGAGTGPVQTFSAGRLLLTPEDHMPFVAVTVPQEQGSDPSMWRANL